MPKPLLLPNNSFMASEIGFRRSSFCGVFCGANCGTGRARTQGSVRLEASRARMVAVRIFRMFASGNEEVELW